MTELHKPRNENTAVKLVPALALTTMSGVAYGLSFPPHGIRPLAWVALVPFFWAIRSGGAGRAGALGAAWACVMTFVTSDCLPGAVVTYYGQSQLVGWLMLLGATVVTMVPYYSCFAVAYWLLSRRRGATLPLLAAAAWVGAEYLRVIVLGGNPWAISGYSQVGVLPLMQVADLAGVHGISFGLVATNAAVLDLWLARSAPEARLPAAIGAAAAGALLLASLGYGMVRLRATGEPLDGGVEIAIVQGNLDLGTQWRRDMYGRNLGEYLKLTRQATEGSDTALVFWPESAMTFFLPDEPAYGAALGHVLGPAGAQLIAGGPRVSANDNGELYFNTTFLISPMGQILEWQDKTKLLPFAEYFPLRSIDLVRRNFGRAQQFTPGDGAKVLPSVAGGAGSIVCNEAMFPEPARDRVAAGAQFLVNPANDSWFGALKYSLQAFDIIRLRAVEQRRYLVRTSTAGPSAVVDPLGRVVVKTEPFTKGWVRGVIWPSDVRTLYSVVGDLFAQACLILAVAGCLWPGCARRGCPESPLADPSSWAHRLNP